MEPTEITYRRRLEQRRAAYYGELTDEADATRAEPEPAAAEAAPASDATPVDETTPQPQPPEGEPAAEAAGRDEAESGATPKRRRRPSSPGTE